MTTRTPENHCLICGYKLDAASAADGQAITPKAGDLSICMKCGAVSKFKKNLTIEPFTEEEINILSNDEQTMQYLAKLTCAIHFVRQIHNRRN